MADESDAPQQKNEGGRPRSPLEDLKRGLYARTPPSAREYDSSLSQHRINIKPSWTREEESTSPLHALFNAFMPWLKRFFVVSIIFFLSAAGIAFYAFWRGSNTVSAEKINITVAGPVAAPAGEELSFEITVGNQNNIDLESVDLLVEYPEGTKQAEDVTTELRRFRDALGKIPALGKESRTVSAVLFGEEGAGKSIHIVAEYRVKGSSATFYKDALYDVAINAAPVRVSITAPKAVSSDQPFEWGIEIISNSDSLIHNLLLNAEYPVGFNFTSASPAPTSGEELWNLGDLPAGGKRIVRIKGALSGAADDERTFRFSVGTASVRDEKQMGTVFLAQSPSLTVKRPFIGLDVALSGEGSKEYIAKSGQVIRADISWANNLKGKVSNFEITAELGGAIFDPRSVSTQGGDYDANTNTITWNKGKNSSYALVNPSAKGRESFSFAILNVATDPASFRNPQMTLRISATGQPLDAVSDSEDLVTTETRTIKVGSSLGLLSRLQYAAGPLTNDGPVPPKPDEETTYTVAWSLSNALNGVSGVKVSAVLPSYVRFIEHWSPASEKLTYNPVGGEVLWDVGDLGSGVGFGTPPRELFFQIAVTPTESQVGTAPVVVGESSAIGEDRFTGESLKSNTRPALTTDLTGDPNAKFGSGIVGK